MIDIIKEFIPYYCALSVCFILLWFIKNNSGFGKQITRCYILSIVSTIVLCFADMGEMYFRTLDHPTIYRTVCSCLGYLLRTASIYFIFLITIRDSKKIVKTILTIPLLINFAVLVLPFFTDIVFYFDEENVFTRGYLGFAPFVVSGFYVACFLIRVFIGLGKANKREGVTVLVILINVLISIALTLIFEDELYMCTGIASSIAFYYLYFHTTLNSEDLLTGAYVRRKFFIDAEMFDRKITGVISLDLNNLTDINNKQGHDKGDETLKTFSSVVMNTLNKQMRLYRVGGDEFDIICFKMTEDEIKNVIEKLTSNLENASCETAIGYAMHDIKRGIDFTVRLADKDMNSNKRAMKIEKEGL